MHKRKLAVLLILILLDLGCAKHPYSVHPGSLSNFDSQAADALVLYQANLNQAKSNIEMGLWPRDWSPEVDKAGELYNTTLQAYLVYRGVAKGVTKGDIAALQTAITTDLQNLADQLTTLYVRSGATLPGGKK